MEVPMLICEGSKIDWTAFAALTALAIWLVDRYGRRRERRASRRLIAQIMTTPVSVAQLEIAKFRCLVVPPGGEDTAFLLKVLSNQTGRKELASKASLITFDLPSQFVDKADLFSEAVSNRLAAAFSQVNRLKSMSQLLGELPDSADEEEIIQNLKLILTQTQETEQVIGEAYKALLNAGTASAGFHRLG